MATIYVLRLEQDKYYVGKTSNFQQRYKNHLNDNGSEWTKLYKTIEVLETHENCEDFDEDRYTISTMAKYGIDNVRGGTFCQVKLTDTDILMINKMINNANDKCFNCGGDHFIRYCPQKVVKKKEPRVNKCFNCGDNHFVGGCPQKQVEVNIQPETSSFFGFVGHLFSEILDYSNGVYDIPNVKETPRISTVNIIDSNRTEEKLDQVKDNILFASDRKYQFQQLIDEMSPTNKTRIKGIFKDERITIDKLKKVISYSVIDKRWYVYDDNKIFPNKNILERFDEIKYPKKGDMIYVTVSDLINRYRHEFENNEKIGRITIDAYLIKIDLNSFKNQNEKGGVLINEIYDDYVEWRKKSGNDKYCDIKIQANFTKYIIKNKSNSFEVIKGSNGKNYLYDIRSDDICSRCGRNSHLVDDCFAKMHLNGSHL